MELKRLRKLYDRHPASEVARRLNRSLTSVYSKAFGLGLKKNGDGFRRGEEASALRAKGLTPREIAMRMGVKMQSVYTYIYLAQHSEQYVKLKETNRKHSKAS